MNVRKLRLLLKLSALILGIGLFAPCLTIVPQFGELTGVVKIFKPTFDSPKIVSIASGIVSLFREGEWFIATIVLTFSVLFPIWKLGVLWGSVEGIALGTKPSSDLRLIEKLGKFSMLDVYVMALLVLTVKQLPGGSEVHLNWGIIPFTISILLSLRIPHWVEAISHQTPAID